MMAIAMQASAQGKAEVNKAQISDRFEFPFYKVSFDSVSRDWPTLSNSENLLLVQEGEYILQRKSKLSPFAVMGDFRQELSAYRLITSMKLVKTNAEEGSIGLIFMAQEGGKGGFIFEINQLQQYRLRQITPGGYAYLTGNPKDGGWSKSGLLKPLNIANLVELRTIDRKYDLYLNNSLLLTFSEISYKSGGLGFIIGPGTLGKVDFLYLFTNEKMNPLTEGNEETAETSNDEGDVVALAESIIELKTHINKLEDQNEELKLRIESFKGSEQEQLKSKALYEGRIASLEKQVQAKQKSLDSMAAANQELLRYKELVKGNEGGDLVITLSKNLKAEKLRADDLLKQNQALRDSIQQLQKSKAGSAKDTAPSGDKSNNMFTLPDEK
ncbi:MAG: hypothetical protein JNL88_02590 [Bacteroidia bacterium]|nr:hypothetical protein [Bacteroidia bacterium]